MKPQKLRDPNTETIGSVEHEHCAKQAFVDARLAILYLVARRYEVLNYRIAEEASPRRYVVSSA